MSPPRMYATVLAGHRYGFAKIRETSTSQVIPLRMDWWMHFFFYGTSALKVLFARGLFNPGNLLSALKPPEDDDEETGRNPKPR